MKHMIRIIVKQKFHEENHLLLIRISVLVHRLDLDFLTIISSIGVYVKDYDFESSLSMSGFGARRLSPMAEEAGLGSPPTGNPPVMDPAAISVQKSYATIVGKPALSKFNVEVSVVDGKAMVIVPDEVLKDSVPLWEDFLVGRFPNAAPHVGRIHVIVNKIWNLGDRSIKIDVYSMNEKMVKFRIRNAAVRNHVLRRGMWNICDQPMIVSKWTPVAEDAQPEIKSMPMWVILKNVPPSMFSWPGLSFLASPVGEPKRLHQETELVTCFDEAKVFVEVDLAKELPKSYIFKIKGEETSVQYEYPWLPPCCGLCNKWGHFDDGCLAAAGKSRTSPNKRVISHHEPGANASTDLSVSLVAPVFESVGVPDKVTSPPATPSVEVPAEQVSTEPVQQLVPVVTVSEVGNIVTEQEEGEFIPLSPISTIQAFGSKDEEWSKVTHSGGGGRAASHTQDGVVPLTIISPTRFDAFREDTMEEELLVETVPAGNLKSTNRDHKDENVTLRPVLPRDSKNAHKYLQASSSQVKASATSGLEFGCLLETKVKDSKASNIVQKVFSTWNMVSNYEFSRLGRIWVVWSGKVKLQVLHKSSQLITCLIQLPNLDEDFVCSFIYASNLEVERKDLWQDIKQQQNSLAFQSKPWILFGDFNETLDPNEHSRVAISPQLTSGMRDFQDLVRYCSFADLRTHGPLFTWSNKQDGGLICKKLDRALHNPGWLQTFPQSYCTMEAGGCSDHLRGTISLTSGFSRSRGPFKFTNAIASQPEFIPRMKSYWQASSPLFQSTSTLFRFSKKLKLLKPILRELGRNKLSDISRRAAAAYDDLCLLQLRTLSSPNPQDLREETKAYERWEKVRQALNSIHEVQNPAGVTLTNSNDIKAEAVRFFTDLLTTAPSDFSGASVEYIGALIPFRCSDHDQTRLTAEVTEAEIKKVIFSMPTNKAPGPDGYTTEFFKEAWDIVGRELILSVKSFFTYGFLPKGLNTTILALIPKTVDVRAMKDYRPISCCNVLYKAISKIIANRLKRILPDIIAPNQSAFIHDRLLMENLLLATELVKDYHKEGISPRCAMKLDISKAFDTVQWSFILNIFRALHFPEQFIHWINLCISTASFSVQVNGELSGFFQSTRGLRQGCSLSPYLFVMSMNVLSHMLDKAAADNRFGYHPKCKNLKLTHLCFADDIMVVSDGTLRSMDHILGVFKEFAEISGLRISLEKSTLFLAGVAGTVRANILSRFPFELGTLPVRYLGLPLLTKRLSLSDCLPLLEKIRSRISSWKNRFLSYAGRLQLLSSVIFSLTNFWISAFRLPSACIKEIEAICSAFLWSGPELSSTKAKVAWRDVCRPKEEGGLGLKSLAEANKVSCFKLIWRLFSANSLWVDWVKSELLRTIVDALRHRRRHHRGELLNQIEAELDKFRNGLGNARDVPLWRGISNKFRPQFSAKDTWLQIRNNGVTLQWAKGIWFSYSTPKFSFISWLATLNRLTTGDRMGAWNSGISTGCAFCNDPWETRDHLFFSCPYSSQVWHDLTSRLLQAQYTPLFWDVVSLISGTQLPPTVRYIIRYVFQSTIHSLWRERNNRRHGERPQPTDQLILLIDRHIRNRCSSLKGDVFSSWLASRY
ncbi:uncharacterized protein LOC111830437 [Capsella rubella]|uniref:uncharacterized protein LOC111830437 n=1 Tax=Capsella rubella TaxID=81985 RepID=UPI000CD4E686|nr:uncharacterized protein LOC111830437 [Capsella rubella]